MDLVTGLQRKMDEHKGEASEEIPKTQDTPEVPGEPPTSSLTTRHAAGVDDARLGEATRAR